MAEKYSDSCRNVSWKMPGEALPALRTRSRLGDPGGVIGTTAHVGES